MTTRRYTENGLSPCEAQLRQIVERWPGPAFLASVDGDLLLCNGAWHERVDASAPMPGWNWLFTPDAAPPSASDEWRRATDTGAPFELTLDLRPPGRSPVTLRIRATPLDEDGQPARWLCLCDPLAPAEATAGPDPAIRQRVDDLETLFETLPIGVFIARDPACRDIRTNPAGARLLGLDQRANASKTGPEGAALPFRIFRDGQEIPNAELPMQRAAWTGCPVEGEVFELHRNDGVVLKLFEYAHPLRDENGKIRGCLGVFVDLTAELAARDAHHESEMRFRVMADHAPVLIWIADAAKRCTWLNKPWLDFVGRTMEQETGDGWLESVHPDDRERCVRIYHESADARRKFQMSYRLRRHDGEYRWLIDHAIPLYTPSGVFLGYIGSSIDVTELEEARKVLHEQKSVLERIVADRTAELKESYDRLRVSERLAALGTLAAGIGHDLGNLLLPVRVRLDLISDRYGPAVTEEVEAIRGSVEYLAKLASGLRMLAVDPATAARADHGVSLVEWWNDVAGLLRNPLPRGVELAADLPPLAIALSPAGLTQAVFNLVQNAGDAMQRSGRGSRITIAARRDGDWACVTVTDDGPGMSDEVLVRCLDPFFTTKARSISTGMGLIFVRGIVQNAGGTLDVASQPGRGTTFTLRLPLLTRTDGPPASPVARVSIGDARVRSYIATMLESAGIRALHGTPCPETVLWVCDGADAEEVERFLTTDSRRRAIVFNSKGEPSSPRVAHLPGGLKPSEARGALHEAVAAIRRGETA